MRGASAFTMAARLLMSMGFIVLIAAGKSAMWWDSRVARWRHSPLSDADVANVAAYVMTTEVRRR